jgi:hypothetical protein
MLNASGSLSAGHGRSPIILLALMSSITSRICRIVQANRKVTQPILKYLLLVAIQYNSTGLINTQYHRDYTRAHAGHVML